MTPAEIARTYREGASLDALSAATGIGPRDLRELLVAAGETIRGVGRPESPARSLARALLSQGAPVEAVMSRTRLSRAQVLAVRWYAEQRAAIDGRNCIAVAARDAQRRIAARDAQRRKRARRRAEGLCARCTDAALPGKTRCTRHDRSRYVARCGLCGVVGHNARTCAAARMALAACEVTT